MISIFQVRDTPTSKSDGIDSNCKAILSTFSCDKDLKILPIRNFEVKRIAFLQSIYISVGDIKKAIKECNPDIVHIHGSYSFTTCNAILAAKCLRKKIVYSPHFHPMYALARPMMGKIFFYAFTKPLLKYVDAVITINEEDTAWFNKYHKSVFELPHWSKFVAPKLDDCRPKNNMILFVGRADDSNKGFDFIYNLPEGKYDIHCVGKGDIFKRSDITQHINIPNDELVELYKQASLLVIPSRYEAFSYVALEALLCNTPIVCSNRVRIADYLHDCNYVKTFEYLDVNGFISAVDMTIGKSVDMDFVKNIFNEDRIKLLYKKIYLDVVQH